MGAARRGPAEAAVRMVSTRSATLSWSTVGCSSASISKVREHFSHFYITEYFTNIYSNLNTTLLFS